VSSERVLVLMKSYLGDAVMATPLLHALARKSLDIRASAVVHDLLRSPDLTYQSLPATNIHRPWLLIREARLLRARRFDTAIVLNRSFRTALLARLAKIPIRVGHATEGRGKLLTHLVPYRMEDPETLSYVHLAEPIGVEVRCLTPRLWVSDEERESGAKALQGIVIAFQPGARYPEKTLTQGAWQFLAGELSKSGQRYAIVGGPEEVNAAAPFTDAANLIGKLSLRESMGMAKSLRVLVGGDTGFMHVAAAVGCPTITAFGPTPVQKWGHFEPPHQVIRAREGKIENISGEELWQAVQRALHAV
jgi:heptosyltransferase-2